jgi:hypothetical protein
MSVNNQFKELGIGFHNLEAKYPMKAVFSFWKTTDDTLIVSRNWLNPQFHLYGWVLAVHYASQLFEEVEIVTDSESLPLFEKLELPFTSIRTDLDELKDYPKNMWCLGKIKAYQIQDKPFVHIDNDFFLMRGIPTPALQSELCFQNMESGLWFESYYGKQFDEINRRVPPKHFGNVRYALNTAFYWCKNLDFNREYTKVVFEVTDSNLDFLKTRLVDGGQYCVLVEQYIASVVVNYMKLNYNTLTTEENFEKSMYNHDFVHIWGAKHSVYWFEKIERIVQKNFNRHYKLINLMNFNP